MTGAYLYEIGVTPYRDAMETMTDLAAARSQGAIPDTVMLLEHEPVITLGSRAVRGEELLLAAVEYTRRGIEVVEVNRGGRSTYHGPGQLVCYPVLDLHDHGKDLHRYVANLEQVVIATLAAFGIDGRVVDGDHASGVWVERPQDRVDRRALRALGDHARPLDQRRPRPRRLRAVRRLRPGRRRLHVGVGRGRPCRSRSTTCARPCAMPSRSGSRSRSTRCRRPSDALLRARTRTARLDEGARPVAATRASPSSRGSCATAACTRSARRPAAPTSASAGAAAPPPSRSWATSARAPAATAPSPRAGPRARPSRWSRCASRRRCAEMGLRHVVVTSVDRDDLPDRGAGHFAATIRAIRRRAPECGVEVLVPDFLGFREEALRTVLGRAAGRVQPQHRDGRALLPADAAERRLPQGAGPARPGQGRVGRAVSGCAAAADQERHHRGHGRDRRGRGRDHARPPRPPRRRGHDRPVPAAERPAPAARPLGDARRSSAGCASRARRWGSRPCSPGRWCDRATVPTSSAWPRAVARASPRTDHGRRRNGSGSSDGGRARRQEAGRRRVVHRQRPRVALDPQREVRSRGRCSRARSSSRTTASTSRWCGRASPTATTTPRRARRTSWS